MGLGPLHRRPRTLSYFFHNFFGSLDFIHKSYSSTSPNSRSSVLWSKTRIVAPRSFGVEFSNFLNIHTLNVICVAVRNDSSAIKQNGPDVRPPQLIEDLRSDCVLTTVSSSQNRFPVPFVWDCGL